MTFDSLQFIAFFVCIFFAYFAVPKRMQSWLLLVASCYFYMAFVPYYVLILFALITVDYFVGRALEQTSGRRRHALFLLSIIANLGTLFFFKYFNFFNANIAELARLIHWNYSLEILRIALPLGLSFHIFQSLAYIIEVYKGRFAAEKSYHTYALYVMFFPQLVAGPIERPAHLLPQLHVAYDFDYNRVVSGLRLMLWGFFKKIVIANWLAVSVDFIYNNIGASDGSVLVVAVFGFAFQLYADFSGYCDIAIGAARVLGIELTQNFRQPYFSRSIAEFWRRWHISLSSWFRDYVYYHLVWYGRTKGAWWLDLSIITTFMLTGVWHGAGWNFVAMGVVFGFYICFAQWTKILRARLWAAVGFAEHSLVKRWVQIVCTFALTALAWVFFRAPSLHVALTIIKKVFTDWSAHSFWYLHCTGYCANYVIGVSNKQFLTILFSIAIMLGYELLESGSIPRPALLQKTPVVIGLYYSLIVWILLAGYFVPKTFIYFQF